jgi:hypothetical protein
MGKEGVMFKRIATLMCCAFLFAVFPARAGEWDKSTTVTFNKPVELPGMVLQAGTYVFKVADIQENRHVVEVLSADQMHFYGYILAIPNYRLQPTSETVMRFAERPIGQPEALRAWFYPGDNFGQEFVYPKVRATELATAVHMPVLGGEVTSTQELKEFAETPVAEITPEPAPEIAAALPEPVPEAIAEPLPAAPAAELTPELPKTGSPLPLIFLLGITSLGFAGALKVTS